jgi:iron complex outermembrane receptor protein
MLLFLSFVLQAMAQKNISGTVTDKVDNHAVQGISIFIPELQRKTITDASGEFTFENTGEGIVTLQFTGIGYKSQIITVNPASEQKEVNISMEASQQSLKKLPLHLTTQSFLIIFPILRTLFRKTN